MALKVIHRLQGFSNGILRPFVQHFTRFILTACSRGPPAIAGLLVYLVTGELTVICVTVGHAVHVHNALAVIAILPVLQLPTW